MFYVLCPFCQTKTEIPADAVGAARTDLFNVACCDACGMSFDYDDEDIVEQEQHDE
jgi:hypothetical protein